MMRAPKIGSAGQHQASESARRFEIRAPGDTIRLIFYRSTMPSQHVFDEFLTYLSAVLPSRSALNRQEFFGERVSRAAVRPIDDMFDHPVLADALKLVGMTASP